MLGQSVTLREGARTERSVVDSGTHVGSSAIVEGAIVGRSCDIRLHARVHEGVAIGDNVTLGSQSVIMPGVRIYPYKEVDSGAQIYESLIWESRATSRLFRNDTVAGLVNVDLTPEAAIRLAAALGTALRRGARVAASRESPPACRMIKRALITGLTATGVDVADLRVMPAPVNRHTLKVHGYDAGVHVGTSASDPEAVEIRFYEPPGVELGPALQKEIEKHFSRQELRRSAYNEVGSIGYPARVRESYAQDLLETIDREAIARRGFRIVVDYGFSAAAYVLPLVLSPLAIEDVSAHAFTAERDGATAPPADSLAQARRLVEAVEAGVGAVLDRGAERLTLVDERGREGPPEQALLLFATSSSCSRPTSARSRISSRSCRSRRSCAATSRARGRRRASSCGS